MSLTGPFYSHASGEGEAANELWVEAGTTLPLNTPNLRLSLRVTLGAGPEIWLPARRPDSNGRVRWYIGELVRDVTRNVVTVPPVGGTQIITNAGVLFLFGVNRMREVCGNPPVQTDEVINLQLRLVVRGGLPARLAATGVRLFGSGQWHQSNGLPFLDHRGSEVRTTPRQDQWLGMLLWELPGGVVANPGTSLHQMLRLLWDDGTSDVEELGSISGTGLLGLSWLLPAGVMQVGIVGYETAYQKRCAGYEIWVEMRNPDHMYSEVKRFVIDRTVYEFTTELQYRNGFGVWTQLMLRGRPVDITAAERTDSSAYHTAGMGAHVGDAAEDVMRVRNGREVASGYLSAMEMRLMGELVASEMVMVKRHGAGWARVRVLNAKHRDDRMGTARRVDVEYEMDYADMVADMFA